MRACALVEVEEEVEGRWDSVMETGTGVQVVPCVALAALAHPGTNHPLAFRVRLRICAPHG